jgi:FeS assembly SUF system regulator
MLRISKLTDYATVILAHLAAAPERRFTAAQIASETGLAGPTVSKLLKQLHRTGLVQSTRGLHGGYLLARPADAITAVHILDALEGPVALTECSGLASPCCIEQTCAVGRAWQRVNRAIRRSLQEITLLELMGLGAHANRPSALDRGLPLHPTLTDPRLSLGPLSSPLEPAQSARVESDEPVTAIKPPRTVKREPL